MSNSRQLWVPLLALVLVACEQPVREARAPAAAEAAPGESDLAAVQQAIADVDRQWEEAANRGDAEAVAALYADDAYFLAPNAELVQGREEIRELLQGLVDMGLANVDFTTVDVGASGDLAYEVGRYSLDLQQPGVSDQGKYVIVARRQADGSWKLVADIFNSSLPAPGAGQ